jgi:hypothetical protein
VQVDLDLLPKPNCGFRGSKSPAIQMLDASKVLDNAKSFSRAKEEAVAVGNVLDRHSQNLDFIVNFPLVQGALRRLQHTMDESSPSEFSILGGLRSLKKRIAKADAIFPLSKVVYDTNNKKIIVVNDYGSGQEVTDEQLKFVAEILEQLERIDIDEFNSMLDHTKVFDLASRLEDEIDSLGFTTEYQHTVLGYTPDDIAKAMLVAVHENAHSELKSIYPTHKELVPLPDEPVFLDDLLIQGVSDLSGMPTKYIDESYAELVRMIVQLKTENGTTDLQSINDDFDGPLRFVDYCLDQLDSRKDVLTDDGKDLLPMLRDGYHSVSEVVSKFKQHVAAKNLLKLPK